MAERTYRVIELKTDSDVFQDVWSGRKTYEIRFNDRDFQVGDTLVLRETEHTGAEMKAGKPLAYTSRELRAEVTHVLAGPIYGLADGWVILSLHELAEGRRYRADRLFASREEADHA